MPAEFAITAIHWDRVHLALTAELGPGAVADPAFALQSHTRLLPVDAVALGGGRYQLSLNVTNFHRRQQLPDGVYRVVAGSVDGQAPVLSAGYDLDRLGELVTASRTFLYAEDDLSYVIGFAISDDDNPELLVHVVQMIRRFPGDGPRPPLARRLVERIAPRELRVRLANSWYLLCRRLSRSKGNRILFASEMRERMEGNLRSVHDRMIERGLDSQFEIRTSFRVPSSATKGTTLGVIRLIATSDIVIVDDYFGMLAALSISPDTKVIQAWHAGSGFKSIGYSRFGNYGSPRLQNAHRKYTYAITGSKHLVPVYAEAFGIEESAVIPTGLPRIDTFLDPARTERIVADFHRRYPQLEGKRRILFAPTFRGRGVQDAYYDYDRIDFDKLYEMCGDESVVLFRMHHFTRRPVPIRAEHADRLLDFSAFGDTNDLLHVTDILITDYSSIIYEYSLLDRPMLFFAYDKEIYSATRGFHRDFDATAPGKICATTDEIVKAIQTEDFETWKIEEFRRENFDRVDTHSADRFIDWLILDEPWPHDSSR